MDTPVRLVPPEKPAEQPQVTQLIVPPQKQLSERGAMLLERAKRADNRIRNKVDRIVQSSLLAAEIDDESPKPEGWTNVQFRVARDARKPMKSRPYYLELAAKAREKYQALDAIKAEAPRLNAEVMNVYVDQRVYPLKDVKE